MARGAFWTIIVDDQPTAFRAPVREDLLPTLKQLQRQHPAATIKWFQRGRLWETPGDAMDAGKPPRRGAGWRPGGDHKDPRDQYKVPRDVKRARWAAQAAEGRGPWMKGNAERRTPNAERPGWKPKGDAGTGAGAPPDPARQGERAAWKPSPDGTPRKPGGKRPFAPRDERTDSQRRNQPPSGDRPAWRPKADGERRPAGDRPAWRPKGEAERRPGADRPRSARSTGDRPAWRPKADGDRRPAGDKPAWRPKADTARGGDRPYAPREPRESRGGKTGWKPSGDRPAGDRPARPPYAEGRGRPAGPRPDWRERRGADRDATPRAGRDGERPSPKPAPKKGRTWRAGELPPADRKKKKKPDES